MKKQKYSALVVDDQCNWRNLLSNVLKDFFEVDLSENMPDALEKIIDRIPPYDIVVTDQRLIDEDKDNQDGLSIAKRVQEKFKSIRIIVVTGYPTFKTQHDALKDIKVEEYFLKYPDGEDFDDEKFLAAAIHAAKDARKDRAKARKRVFGITPFNSEFVECNQTITNVMDANGLTYFQAGNDKDFEALSIPEQIEEGIENSWFSIADLTHANPNVYFEIGYAHAIGKNVILITQQVEDLTRRLEIIRAHVYENTLGGGNNLSKFLSDKISEFKKKEGKKGGNSILYPRSRAPVNKDLCLVLTCSNEQKAMEYSEDTLEQIIKPCLEIFEFQHQRANEAGINSREKLSDLIQSASLVVVDLTGNDPDVFYLAGLAYGRGKNPIVLARKEEKPPFDFKIFEPILYSKDLIIERKQAQKELRGRIEKQFPGRLKISAQSKPPDDSVTPAQEKSTKRGSEFRVDAAILTILPEEHEAVYKRLNNIRLPDLGGTNLYAWQVGDVDCPKHHGAYSVALALLSQAGNSTSQEAALDAIEQMQPRYIFLVGIAGGIQKLQLGDVAVANHIRGYEYGKIDNGFQVRDLGLTPTDIGLFNGTSVFANTCSWQSGITLLPPGPRAPRHWMGEIASGEKVIDDLSDPFAQAVLGKFPKLIAFEMEGAGVANAMRIAQARGRVGRFIVIRGISDLPGMTAPGDEPRGTAVRDNWKPYAADAAAAFTMGYIANGLPEAPLTRGVLFAPE